MTSLPLSTALAGFSMGLGLIVAIGAQNAFVLRQGLRGEHVLAVCLTCAISDAVLIVIGVTSFARIAAALPGVDPVLRWGGAAFLILYGARSLWSACRGTGALEVRGEGAGLAATLATALAFTWLNPHVWLDTVVLLGTVSSRFPGEEAAFAAGAITASFAFFFALGYGARWLRPIFTNPAAWRILEAGIALLLWGLAARLILG